jgi:hypothetical protein
MGEAREAVTRLLEDVYDGGWTQRDVDVAEAVMAAAAPAIRARHEAEFAAHSARLQASIQDIVKRAVDAERERIRQLAIKHHASYYVGGIAQPQLTFTGLFREFADLLGGVS